MAPLFWCHNSGFTVSAPQFRPKPQYRGHYCDAPQFRCAIMLAVCSFQTRLEPRALSGQLVEPTIVGRTPPWPEDAPCAAFGTPRRHSITPPPKSQHGASSCPSGALALLVGPKKKSYPQPPPCLSHDKPGLSLFVST